MTHSTSDRREQARGNGVAQAGQFGHQSHSAPGAFDNTWWGQEPEPEEAVASVYIDVNVRRFGLPSNRHRKEQSYVTPGVLNVEVPIVDRAEVLAAATITDRHGKTRALLIRGGQLFESTGRDLDDELPSGHGLRQPGWGDPKDGPPLIEEDRIDALQQEAANEWIVVDGVVHLPVEEPVLIAQSWGVQLEDARYARAVDERGFISDDTVFTLDEWEQAKAASVASQRTYEDGSRDVDEGIAFEAGDGLAGFSSKYRRPPKLDYDAWPQHDWKDRNEVYPRELAKMRSGIVQVPDAVSRVDDGLGGTRAVIDWTLFSKQQERDYGHLVEYSGE